jgi:hypothetical protein
VIEKTKDKSLVTATDSTPRPGDFPLGSPQSRAAARALVERRRPPDRPPDATFDFRHESIERCQQIYASVAAIRAVAAERDPTPDYALLHVQLLFPDGFTPDPEQVTVVKDQTRRPIVDVPIDEDEG